jgi:hypothetical protein
VPYGSIFNALFGSWFGDFDQVGNLMRSYLGAKPIQTPNGALVGGPLVVLQGSRPNWFLHPMGLGEPISTSLLIAQNSPAIYQPTNVYSRTINAALMGDPTLTMTIVKPVSNLRVQTNAGYTARNLTWDASGDAASSGFLGYYVYRSGSPDGPFTRITSNYVTGTSYTDPLSGLGKIYYMVRAVKTETTASGTYINASTGILAGSKGPKGELAQFNYTIDHDLTVTFDRNVSSVVSAGDLLLTKVGDDDFSRTITLASYNTSTNTAKFTFSGGLLPDGNYRAFISADDVTLSGEEMTDDVVLDFYVLGADANGDRAVNLTDYNIMSANFGQSGKTFAEGNFDYDAAGNVNLADYNVLSAHFGASLPAPPSGPGVITASVISPNEVTVTWIDNVSGETGWRVQRSTDGTTFDWYENVDADSTSFTATDLEDGTRYWFRVRAYSDAGSNPNGPNTAYTAKKAGTTLLPAPTDLAVDLHGDTVQLAWTQSAINASHALIQRSTDGFTWSTIEQIEATHNAYEDAGRSTGVRYYYRVVLENSLIESAPSYVEYIDVP